MGFVGPFPSSHSGSGGGGGRVMRVLPLFIILLLFSALVILVYMGWVAYRGREDEGLFRSKAPYLQKVQPQKDPAKKANNKGSLLPPLIGEGDQSFDNLNQDKRKEEASSDEDFMEGLPVQPFNLDPDLQKKIDLLKMKVISNLRRHVLNGAKPNGHINEYGVDFAAHKAKSKRLDRKKVLCQIKNLQISFVNKKSDPGIFSDRNFPSESIFDDQTSNTESVTPTPLYKKCAVIPNSAAFDGARHGIDIDSHDFIIRFNNAPTGGYEGDVGSLTSLRIVNSQVVTKPKFAFPSSKYYLNKVNKTTTNESTRHESDPANSSHEERVTKSELAGMDLDRVWEGTRKYLIWDPCAYGTSIKDWVASPDFPVFDKYFNLTKGPERNRFYLLDCRVVWKMWTMLQEHSIAKIHGTPPTSGFIGILLALQVCERVNVFEYIPSVRESARCHYYGPKNESNPSCTYGSWHPVSAEKLFFVSLSDGTDKEIFYEGVMTLPGVSAFKC